MTSIRRVKNIKLSAALFIGHTNGKVRFSFENWKREVGRREAEDQSQEPEDGSIKCDCTC